MKGERTELTFAVPEKPGRVVFDAGRDVPVPLANPYAFVNFTDDFTRTKIVYGTTRQIEANHTLALRFQTLARRLLQRGAAARREGRRAHGRGARRERPLPPRRAVRQRARRAPRREAPRRPSATASSPATGRRTPAPTTASTSASRTPGTRSGSSGSSPANSALELHQMTKAWAGSLPQWARLPRRRDQVPGLGAGRPVRLREPGGVGAGGSSRRAKSARRSPNAPRTRALTSA